MMEEERYTINDSGKPELDWEHGWGKGLRIYPKLLPINMRI